MNPFTQKRFDDFDGADRECPILADPLPECYCFEMTSIKVPYAVKYCLNDFSICDIYQRVKKHTDS